MTKKRGSSASDPDCDNLDYTHSDCREKAIDEVQAIYKVCKDRELERILSFLCAQEVCEWRESDVGPVFVMRHGIKKRIKRIITHIYNHRRVHEQLLSIDHVKKFEGYCVEIHGLVNSEKLYTIFKRYIGMVTEKTKGSHLAMKRISDFHKRSRIRGACILLLSCILFDNKYNKYLVMKKDGFLLTESGMGSYINDGADQTEQKDTNDDAFYLHTQPRRSKTGKRKRKHKALLAICAAQQSLPQAKKAKIRKQPSKRNIHTTGGDPSSSMSATGGTCVQNTDALRAFISPRCIQERIASSGDRSSLSVILKSIRDELRQIRNDSGPSYPELVNIRTHLFFTGKIKKHVNEKSIDKYLNTFNYKSCSNPINWSGLYLTAMYCVNTGYKDKGYKILDDISKQDCRLTPFEGIDNLSAYSLALYYFRDERDEEATDILKDLSDKYFPIAMYALALNKLKDLASNPYLDEANKKLSGEAFALLHVLQNNGYKIGAHLVALCYLFGVGCDQSKAMCSRIMRHNNSQFKGNAEMIETIMDTLTESTMPLMLSSILAEESYIYQKEIDSLFDPLAAPGENIFFWSRLTQDQDLNLKHSPPSTSLIPATHLPPSEIVQKGYLSSLLAMGGLYEKAKESLYRPGPDRTTSLQVIRPSIQHLTRSTKSFYVPETMFAKKGHEFLRLVLKLKGSGNVSFCVGKNSYLMNNKKTGLRDRRGSKQYPALPDFNITNKKGEPSTLDEGGITMSIMGKLCSDLTFINLVHLSPEELVGVGAIFFSVILNMGATGVTPFSKELFPLELLMLLLSPYYNSQFPDRHGDFREPDEAVLRHVFSQENILKEPCFKTIFKSPFSYLNRDGDVLDWIDDDVHFSDYVKEWLEESKVDRLSVAGGGFIPFSFYIWVAVQMRAGFCYSPDKNIEAKKSFENIKQQHFRCLWAHLSADARASEQSCVGGPGLFYGEPVTVDTLVKSFRLFNENSGEITPSSGATSSVLDGIHRAVKMCCNSSVSKINGCATSQKADMLARYLCRAITSAHAICPSTIIRVSAFDCDQPTHPSAETCTNTLKVPLYDGKVSEKLHEQLFELMVAGLLPEERVGLGLPSIDDIGPAFGVT